MKVIYSIFHLSIFYPILFQIFFGVLYWMKKTKFSFSRICYITIITEIIFIFSIFINNYLKIDKCLNPLLDLLGVFFGTFILLIFIIILQLIINYLIKYANTPKPQ